MRIAQVAPLYESVPPKHYGGTERVVSYLTEALVAAGHEVTLFASGDSVTSARLEPGCAESIRLAGRAADLALHLGMLLRVYERASEFDVIHCHTDYLGLALSRGTAVPTVATLHGRLDIPENHPIYRAFPDVAFVSISDAQRRDIPDISWAATVHHGLPEDLYRFHPEQGRYLLFLGRISPEKRPDSAIRIAIAAGVPLRIAAKVDPADQVYFEHVIQPLLDHPLVEFLGEVDDHRKVALLGDALALLFPIDWPEPFGLVMIEALASGTPVIARRRGSVPEVVTDGLTGILGETDEELTAGVARARRLERAVCRAEFERRFTAGRMADDYLAVYEAARARRSGAPFRARAARAAPVSGLSKLVSSAG